MCIRDSLIDVMGPVILVVGIGWVAGKRMSFDIATLSRMVFWVIGPLFVLYVFADAELDRDTVWRLSIAGLIAMVVGAAVAYAVGQRLGLGVSRRNAAVMTSAYGNVGNAGLVISAFAFGDDAIPAAAVLMVVINGTGILLGVSLASAEALGIGAAIKRAALTPMNLAAVVALVLNAANLDFPTAFERTIELVGASLIPVMLLTLGMQLAGDFSLSLDADFGLVTIAKLVVVPLSLIHI